MDDEVVSQLSPDECWAMLREEEFARLAFRMVDEVHITPINYAVDHDPVSGRHSLLFRTAEGSKLLGVVMNADVAFEVDHVEGEHAPGPGMEDLGALERAGLVRLAGAHVSLSEEGEKRARLVVRRHRLAERLLTDILGLPWAEAHEEAGKWEHVISEPVERAINRLLERPVDQARAELEARGLVA